MAAEAREASARGAAPPGGWRRKALLALLAVVVLALSWIVWLGVAWVTDPQAFPIAHVEVRGSFGHVAAKDLQAAIAPATGVGFMKVDVEHIRAEVEKLPWVQEVSVRRIWPDTLHVTITEHTALARWGDDALVDVRGKVYSAPRDTFPQGLPLFVGPVDTGEIVSQRYRDTSRLLETINLKLAAIQLDERRAWRLTLDNGIQVLMGRDESNAHLLRFVRTWPKVLAAQAQNIARVDLRYTNGFAVGWRGHQPPAPLG